MGKISNIQVLRGFAALAVVIFHAREEVDAIGRATRIPSLMVGAFGVDLFFTISGFVMVYASRSLFGTWRSAVPFMAKRVARVAPLYWIVTALFAFYVAHDPAERMSRQAFTRFLATSFAFVPYVAPANPDAFPVYPLGWTLDYEMFFYVCFAALIGLSRRGTIATLSCGFVVFAALSATVPLPAPLAYLGASQILEFVAGMLIAELFIGGLQIPRGSALALVAAAVLAIPLSVPSYADWWGTWRGIVWGVPAAAIVGAAAFCPPQGEGGVVRRWLERLGDASYALYLVHYGLYVAIEAVLGRLVRLDRLPAALFMSLLIASALPAAFVVHRFVEAPLTRALQRRIRTRRVGVPAAARS